MSPVTLISEVNETVFDPSYAQKKQTAKKVFILEDYHDSSQKIRCHFQEIDRDLGFVSAKETVVVTGRMTHDGSLQVFNIENFNPEEVFVLLEENGVKPTTHIACLQHLPGNRYDFTFRTVTFRRMFRGKLLVSPAFKASTRRL